jgi:hypothetical protein
MRPSGGVQEQREARICNWEGSSDRISHVWDCGKRHLEATRQDGCDSQAVLQLIYNV